MVESSPPGIAEIHRYLLRDARMVVATGELAPLFDAWAAHARRWDLRVDPLGEVMMRQGLGGAALQLAMRPRAESLGWTINVEKPPMNLFITGQADAGILHGRIFDEGVDASQGSRMFVQTHRGAHESSTSTVSVEGLDILLHYESYFRDSVQLPTRFFELSDTRMIMVQGLPNVDAGQLATLDREGAQELLGEGAENLDIKTVRLECGCDPVKLGSALARMFGENPEELFQDDPGVEAQCPRCGARYWIDRPTFDRARQDENRP